MKTETQDCPFCVNKNRVIIIESDQAYSIYDKYPVNPGHALIIPKRHVEDYFALTGEEKSSCWELVDKVKATLDKKYSPDAYNIGINNLAAAGQTIPHVHIHLIPRYLGDVPRPQGGIRAVIPEKKEFNLLDSQKSVKLCLRQQFFFKLSFLKIFDGLKPVERI